MYPWCLCAYLPRPLVPWGPFLGVHNEAGQSALQARLYLKVVRAEKQVPGQAGAELRDAM